MKKLYVFVVTAVFFAGCSFKSIDSVDHSGNDSFDSADEMVSHLDGEEADGNLISDNDISETEEIVIATYNTLRFFDTVCDTGSCSSSDYEEQFSSSEYSEKVKDVADALNLINADIVLLQEVEKKICLEDLFEKMNGLYNDFFIGETGYNASVDTAVLTKGKITFTDKHTQSIPLPAGGTTTFARAFLETHIDFSGKKIIVFSAHFKAKSNDDPDRRQAEANAALKIINETADQFPDALIVMGGDLNDTPGSGPVSALEDSPGLVRVASELSSANQATYWYDGPIAIDHLFHSIYASGSYISGSAEVIKDSPSRYELISSDHAALRASFGF